MTEFEIKLIEVLRDIHHAIQELGLHGAERIIELIEENNEIQRFIVDDEDDQP